ncbi:MAG: hypothetical protein ABI411_07310 [Tahibacter sp.]
MRTLSVLPLLGVLITLGSVSTSAPAAITLDLSYVNTASPSYIRFKNWVDQAVAGNPGYAFSATDAAYVYRVQGGAAYANLAIQMVEAQVVAAEAAIAANQVPEVAGDQYLYVGGMIGDLALVYDWCNPLLTPSQRTRWAAYAEQAVWNVWHHDTASWGGHPAPWAGWSIDNPGNNYHYSFLEATMYWTFASNSSPWRTFLETQKIPPLTAYFAALPGGGSREGTGYGLSHQRLFELYRFWRDNTGTNLATQNTHLNDSLDYWIHATVPTRDFVAPLGDQARVSEPAIYDYHRNVVLQARAMSNNAAAQQRATWWLSNISMPQMSSGFNFRHDMLPVGSGGQVPTALYYRATGTGALFARTAWDTNAMWLSFMAGPYLESHAHQDQGSFTLYAHHWLAVTENIWTHSGIQQGTDVHNVVRFVKNGQTINQRDNTTSNMTVTPGANGVLDVSANLTPAYAGNPDITSWQRTLHFANRVLRVSDQFAIGSGVQAVFQLNVPSMPVISGHTARAGDLAINVLTPANATLTLVDWHSLDNDEFRSGWKLEVRGNGNQFVVDLSEASDAIFANGFQ